MDYNCGLMNLRLIIVIAVVMCIPASVFCAQKSANSTSIVLMVRDESGAAVAHARVQIQSSSTSNTGQDLVTAADGKLSIDVSPGGYDLSVDSPSFMKFTKHIDAEPGAVQTVNVVLKVKVCEPCPVVSNVFPITFPAASQAVSPDGHYAVVEATGDAASHHTVFIENRTLKSRRRLFNYDQRIVVLWNYDSRLFAVTKYTNGGSRCTVFSVAESAPPISVLDVLSRQLSKDTWEQLESQLRNRHVYVDAVVWDGVKDLQVGISVNGDEDSAHFTDVYRVLLPVENP